MASVASAAAKRDELQKRLYLLKEQRAREQRVFDELAANNEALSATQIHALAQQRAAAAAPTSMCVKGEDVCVGALVRVLDDVALWLQCEGSAAAAADPLKRVYLGETGRVVRVLPTYQDKQAVELRFADGAEKLFFADCLDVGSARQATQSQSSSQPRKRQQQEQRQQDQQQSSDTESEDAAAAAADKPMQDADDNGGDDGNKRSDSHRSAPASSAAPDTALPTWQEVQQLRKRVRVTPATAATATATTSIVRDNSSNNSSNSNNDSNAANVATQTATTAATTTVAADESAVVATPFHRLGLVREAFADNLPLHHHHSRHDTGDDNNNSNNNNMDSSSHNNNNNDGDSSSSSSSATRGLVSHLAAAAGVTEELGKPYETSALAQTSLCTIAGSELDNLLATPRTDLFLLPTSRPLLGGRRLPNTCSPDYVAVYAFDDKTTQIPRLPRSAHTTAVVAARRCWVAGLAPGQQRPLRYTTVLFCSNSSNNNNNSNNNNKSSSGSADSMAAILQSVTTALGWHACGLAATRLFTAEGSELMWPEALREGMRLIATTGAAYCPPTSHNATTTTTTTATTSTGGSPVATTTTMTNTETTPPPRRAASTMSAAPVTRALAKTTTTATAQGSQPRDGRKGTRRVRPALSLAKPIHICVYENGVYDESAYERVSHTITVRPTYKSLRALYSIIERELGWRDGRHVDVLYDASGSVLNSLADLFDGASVVASAGDRFVVPYPNTQLHYAAMQLAARRAAA